MTSGAPVESEGPRIPRDARSLSFVLPAFNEAVHIATAVRRCVEVGERLGRGFEVVVVDDGSRDDTRRIVEGLASVDARVRTVHHARNRGYGAALKSGLFAAKGDLVFFTDADLQFDVAEVDRLLAWTDRYAIVAGYRAPRRDGWGRRFNGWAWTRLVDALFGVGVRDVDCAFKVFDRRIFDRIPVYSIGAFVNTEILVRARAEGFEVIEVPVSHFPRTAGQATGANPRVVLKAVHELWLLRSELRSLAPAEVERRGSATATTAREP